MSPAQLEALQRGKRTQTERAALKRRVRTSYPLDEEDWYEIIESRWIDNVEVDKVLRWIPRLGQGHDGADVVVGRILGRAGVRATRRCGELTLRQSAALIREILEHGPRSR